MMTQAGLINDDVGDTGETGNVQPKGSRSLTEGAILADPQLTDEQKQALLAVYQQLSR